MLRLVPPLLLAFVLLGCDRQNTYVEPPPPKVTVAKPLVTEVTEYLEFTGTTVASARVDVPARVKGFLQSMHFQPGTDVEKGELLFVIEPTEYEAALQSALADLAAAQAQFKKAEIELERAQKLFEKQAGSAQDVVRWRGEKEVAGAAVKRAEAQVARAELNLSYTEVKAPISGRIGRNRVDVGNLVGEAGATVLTEVTRYDPMYVYFNLNERDLLRLMTVYRQRVKDKGLDPANDPDREAEIKLFLGLADEAGYPHEGVLDFGESGLDPGTGTLQLLGTFENAQLPAVLIPGLFARVRFPVGKFSDRPLVTERAIGADQGGRFLLVVNDDGTVEKRNITLGQLVDGLRVVHEGLQAHDWVVVNGVQRARPGAKVDPEQIDMALLASSALEAPPQAGEADPGGSASGTAND